MLIDGLDDVQSRSLRVGLTAMCCQFNYLIQATIELQLTY